MRRLLPLIVLVLFAIAAKGGGGGATLALDQPFPHHRDTVTFTYTLPDSRNDCGNLPSGKCALIRVRCYQGATLVYAWVEAVKGHAFYLESGTYEDGTPFWPEGPADCEATMYGYKGKAPFPVVNFHVEA